MKPAALRMFFISVLFALGYIPSSVKAQDRNSDVILPAGTLLRCTLNEPNFSSKTADVGDPVTCDLSAVIVFGHAAFGHGAYLGGHLDAEKDPGHFFGKGYLQLQFDRIGTPEGLLPVPVKIVALRGYRVDRDGKIIGHGHATRDAVEWLFPPLWPEKVLTLPARGPRPTLKGEQRLTLRLMDDVAIPAEPPAQMRNAARPSAEYLPNRTYEFPNQYFPARTPVPPPAKVGPVSNLPAQAAATPRRPATAPGASSPSATESVLVMRNGISYPATNIHVDGSRLLYTLDGTASGVVRLEDVDWTRTFQTNAEHGVVLTLNGANSTR